MNKQQALVSVPYTEDQSYDFYSDKIVFNGVEILYKDILGYGVKYSHNSTSVYYVPVSNSSSFRINLELEDGVVYFERRASGALSIKSKKQLAIDTVFRDVYKYIQIFIAPHVYNKCLDKLETEGELKISDLTINGYGISKKGFFNKKTLPFSDYKEAFTESGIVKIRTNAGKLFYGCALSEINAPLIGPILDSLVVEKPENISKTGIQTKSKKVNDKCENCSYLLEKGAKFCTNCGTKIFVLENIKKTNSKIEIASGTSRLINYIFDTVGYLLTALALSWMAYFVIWIYVQNSDNTSKTSEIFNNPLLVYLFLSMGFFLYYFVMESFWGRTLGKFITETRVVDEDGELPGYNKIIIRTICRLIPFDAFSYLTSKPVGWHDSLSSTKVIKISKK